MSSLIVGRENAKLLGLRVNDQGSGRPLVLIHGLAPDSNCWEQQRGPLLAAGFRAVSYDRQGFGSSSANITRRLNGSLRVPPPTDHALSFGPFRLLPSQRLLLEGETPIHAHAQRPMREGLRILGMAHTHDRHQEFLAHHGPCMEVVMPGAPPWRRMAISFALRPCARFQT